MVTDSAPGHPSQDTLAPTQQPEVREISTDTPTQSGANTILIINPELPGVASKNSKSKDTKIGCPKKKALGQTPLYTKKNTRSHAPLTNTEALNLSIQPSG